MSIKAIVFDYGGVICFPPSSETVSELAKLTGLSADTLRELNSQYRGEWDRGSYDGIEYYKNILSNSGIFLDDESLSQIVLTDTGGWRHLNYAAIQLMRDVKATGLVLGILSNMPYEFLAWARREISIFNEANIGIFSCDYHLIKPEAEIYEKLREKLGCEFGDIIFFDDTEVNIKKAKELGIHAFVWEGPDAARKIIAETGISLASS